MISCTCAVEGLPALARRRGERRLTLAVAVAVLGTCLAAAPAAATRPHESVGWRSTGIPIANFSSDDGTGYGLRYNLYEYDGATVPYRRKFGVQAFATTGGKWVHRLLADLPDLRPGERLEVELLYEKEEYANYYGDLPDERVNLYSRDQKTFRQAYPEVRVLWIRSLRDGWYYRLEGRLNHTSIDANAESGSLLRDLDPPGRRGGAFGQVLTSLRCDSRDNYKDTEAGQLAEVFIQYGRGQSDPDPLGLPGGITVGGDHRWFRRLVAGTVLATRLRGEAVFGDVPFYEELDMGGSSSVRGLAASRDRGEARLLGNAELRWRGLPLSRQRHIYLGALAFADVGQIFTRADGPAANAWRRGLGAGLRLHWHSTILRADYGRSGGRAGLYITFGQVF